MKTKSPVKDFTENRTSWKYFANQMEKSALTGFPLACKLLLEVLKELQFMNDTKVKKSK